jgi:hypothetical protein
VQCHKTSDLTSLTVSSLTDIGNTSPTIFFYVSHGIVRHSIVINVFVGIQKLNTILLNLTGFPFQNSMVSNFLLISNSQMTIYKMPPYSQLFRHTVTNFHVTINTCPFLKVQTLWHKDCHSGIYFINKLLIKLHIIINLYDSYIALRITRFLDFVQQLVFKKGTQCFENQIHCYLI